MTASDDDQLAELAARLSADDPAFAHRLGGVPHPRNRWRWAAGTAIVSGTLVLLGSLTGNVPLALMAVPVAATATLAVRGRTVRDAWRAIDPDTIPPEPGRADR
ncbi:DUF3040 domain-containing protein [Klenkia sp. LSe6-5]|uniref:DUF3040 domain-containing protein n=1 Tax=Klenkia sesuvii TaxID=3103137 RepID=A0ABU8DTP6_9ACTN